MPPKMNDCFRHIEWNMTHRKSQPIEAYIDLEKHNKCNSYQKPKTFIQFKSEIIHKLIHLFFNLCLN